MVTPRSRTYSAASGAGLLAGRLSVGGVSGALALASTMGGFVPAVALSVPATPGASSGELPTLTTVTPSVTGTHGFSFGQAFKEGAIAASDKLTGLQLDPLTYHPDGSVKHGVVSGSAAMIADTPYTVVMSIGSAAAGATLASADMAAAFTSAGGFISLTAGAFGTADIGSGDMATPAHAVFEGPRASRRVYRKALSADGHLVLWAEITHSSTGQVEIFPWIENGYLNVASPTNKSALFELSIGGTVRFSQTIDVKHHTRIPLVNTATGQGSTRTFSHWLGTDPGVVPAHDGAYLRATKAIPNSHWAAPSGTALDAAQQTYTPNTLANDDNATGGTGGSGAIISAASARYVNSGDLRAWKAMMAHALSAGSWSWHYRDSSTHQPALYSAYPNSGIGDVAIPGGTGGTNHVGGPAMSHMPSYAYLPFLVTGRWWFLEELQFQATWGFLSVTPAYRNFGNHTITTGSGYTVRGGAWSLNLAAQAAAATPTSHALSAQFVATWERSMAALYGRHVSGSITADFTGVPFGGSLVNPLGVMGSYSGASGAETPWPPPNASRDEWWDAMYQHNYIAAVLGYSSDLGIEQSPTSLANHVAARDHSYKLVIGRADDGLFGRFNWRRFICFAAPIGTNATGLPVDTPFTTFEQMYAGLVFGWGLDANLPATPGLTLKQHSSDVDLTNGDSSRPYGSSAIAALALAVDHGVFGASEGLLRITTASNFASSFNAWMADDEPQWAIKPRLPSWVPALNTVGYLGTTTLAEDMGFSPNFMRPWCGMTFIPWAGRNGKIRIANGGHTDGTNNEEQFLDLDLPVPRFVQRKPSAPVFDKPGNATAYDDICDPDSGWLWTNATPGDTTVQVGEPAPMHSCCSTVALPPSAIPGDTSSPLGWIFDSGRAGLAITGQLSASPGFKFPVSTSAGNLWSHHGAMPNSERVLGYWFHRGVATINGYDAKRRRVVYRLMFSATGGSPSKVYGWRSTVDGSWGYQEMTGPAPAISTNYTRGGWSDRHDAMIEVHRTGTGPWNRVFFTDFTANQDYEVTITGTSPELLDGASWCWSDVWNCLVAIDGRTNDVHFCKPSGNPRTQPWVWSKQAVTGVSMLPPEIISSQDVHGMNRICHVPAIGNVLIRLARDNARVECVHVAPP